MMNLERWLADASESLSQAHLSYIEGDVLDTCERLEYLIEDLPKLLDMIQKAVAARDRTEPKIT